MPKKPRNSLSVTSGPQSASRLSKQATNPALLILPGNIGAGFFQRSSVGWLPGYLGRRSLLNQSTKCLLATVMLLLVTLPPGLLEAGLGVGAGCCCSVFASCASALA